MSHQNTISFEELNYFIDGQLTRNERVKVLDVLKKDDELSKSLCELQRNDEFVLISYSHIPEPKYNPYLAATRKTGRKMLALVASVLVTLSVLIGSQLNTYLVSSQTPNIMDLSQLGDRLPKNSKVLIHVSEMDSERITKALDKAESLLLEKQNEKIQVEIIANASGLGVLRTNSPYKNRISSLASKHTNVKFKACGIAMQAAELKEGKAVQLVPEAEKVPAALDEILKRLKENWAYFKA